MIIRPVMRLVKFPTDIQEIEEPGPRDDIFWGDEDVELPKGKVRPIFVTSRSQIKGETRALDTQIQYAVAYYVFWSVSDDVATFRRNSRSLAEADSQIKKISLTLLDQIVGALTAEGVIADQANVNDRFDDAICRKAYGMGVEIHQAGLHGFNLSHEMARAMRNRAKAQFELETTNMQTDGQARRIREIGKAEGDADYERAKASIEGRADGMAILKENLGASGEAVLAFEAVREILPKSTVLAGASAGASDLAGVVGTMAATFTAMKGGDQASKKSKEEDGQ
ncbi:MAG TPA: SPFH domain-containing protein [Candidatus Paceibacterota bacterium]|nr:SPFH domain-containing protein [Candidatus Paceibacterota bacterium]